MVAYFYLTSAHMAQLTVGAGAHTEGSTMFQP